jgi:beta-glucanase (GH16 family)
MGTALDSRNSSDGGIYGQRRPPGPRDRAVTWLARRRGPLLFAGAGVAVVAAAVVVAIVVSSGPPDEPVNENHGPLPTAASPPAVDQPVLPVGQTTGWTLAFSDEFESTSLSTGKWQDTSSAEADQGHGNLDNHQLEWNQAANCTVSQGQLTMTAKREAYTSRSGTHYDWTSCLLTTTHSFGFQYGYIEERSILPSAKGFWPAFWTWQAPGVDQQLETDVYELYTAHPRTMLFTQHSGETGACQRRPGFDPTAGWHTYGAAITPAGTTWYLDGVRFCQTPATSAGNANVITNLAVDGQSPPDGGTDSAVKVVDYIRAWTQS